MALGFIALTMWGIANAGATVFHRLWSLQGMM
jgi:hypothetical protein